jgi:hypothetical protein
MTLGCVTRERVTRERVTRERVTRECVTRGSRVVSYLVSLIPRCLVWEKERVFRGEAKRYWFAGVGHRGHRAVR